MTSGPRELPDEFLLSASARPSAGGRRAARGERASILLAPAQVGACSGGRVPSLCQERPTSLAPPQVGFAPGGRWPGARVGSGGGHTLPQVLSPEVFQESCHRCPSGFRVSPRCSGVPVLWLPTPTSSLSWGWRWGQGKDQEEVAARLRRALRLAVQQLPRRAGLAQGRKGPGGPRVGRPVLSAAAGATSGLCPTCSGQDALFLRGGGASGLERGQRSPAPSPARWHRG